MLLSNSLNKFQEIIFDYGTHAGGGRGGCQRKESGLHG